MISRISSLEDKVQLLQSTQLQMQQSIQEILTELKNCSKILKEQFGSDSELLDPPRKSAFAWCDTLLFIPIIIGRRYDIQETIESDDISDIPNRPSNMSIRSLIFTTTPPSPESTPNMPNIKISKSPKSFSDPATPSTYATGSPELHACERPNQPDSSHTSIKQPTAMGRVIIFSALR